MSGAETARVLVLDSPYDERPLEEEALPHLRVERLRRADLSQPAPDVAGLIVDMAPVDRELLDLLPGLRCVSVTGIGLDAIDLAEAERRGIAVVNVPDESVEEVATHAVALLLALVRRLRPYHRHVAGGGFRHDESGPVPRLSRLTVCIAGFGRIGQATAARLAPFGCRLLGWDDYVEDGVFAAAGVERAGLDELCARSHALTVHLPLNEGTLDLFGEERLRALPPGALLVNTSRGKVVDTKTVIELVRSGRLGGAALDVFREEPPGWELELAGAGDNVILTPHCAFYSHESEEEIRRRACRNLYRVLKETADVDR